jgi:hypothetical protein
MYIVQRNGVSDELEAAGLVARRALVSPQVWRRGVGMDVCLAGEWRGPPEPDGFMA